MFFFKEKRFLNLVFFESFLIFTFTLFAGENLLKNGSFENGTDGWTQYPTDKDFITTGTDDDALSGQKAGFIKMEGHFQDNPVSAHLYQSIPVTPGHIYSVSGYHKQDTAFGHTTVYIMIAYYGKDGFVDDDFIKWGNDLSYTKVFINSIAPKGATSMNIMPTVVKGASGEVIGHFDDMVVTEDDWYIANENVFQNGDFEQGNTNGWTVTSGSATIVSDNPHSGSKVLKLSGANASMYQRVVIEEGATYNIYGYSRISSAGGLSWFQIAYYDASGSMIKGWNTDFSETWVNKTEYVLTSRELEPPPANAKTIEISCWNQNSNSVSYYDDIRLVVLKKKDDVGNLNHFKNYSGVNTVLIRNDIASSIFLPNGRSIGKSDLVKSIANGMHIYCREIQVDVFK